MNVYGYMNNECDGGALRMLATNGLHSFYFSVHYLCEA